MAAATRPSSASSDDAPPGSRRGKARRQADDEVRAAARQAKADILQAAGEVRKAAGSTRRAVDESKREVRRARAEAAAARRARGRGERSADDDDPGTWQRIVDVATTLFTDQGYDGTSLREIADELGFTKAALYYHFRSKEEILLAILGPTRELLDEFMARLEGAGSLDAWAEALDWVIDQMADHVDIFRLSERNRTVVETLAHTSKDFEDHQELHRRLEKAVKESTASQSEQIRMIAALAAVTGFDDWGPTLVHEIPIDELTVELKAISRQILRVPPDAGADAGGVDAEPAAG